MQRFYKKILIGVLMAGLLAGCASAPVVQPTYEETQAAMKQKKTVAIVEFTSDRETPKSARAVALSSLESFLSGYFNLVERNKIDQVMAERNFSAQDFTEKTSELGKLLGADYLIFGSVAASVSEPELRQRQWRGKDNQFQGYIWKETHAESEVSMKMVDVNNGMVVYSGKQIEQADHRTQEESFYDEASFRRALREKGVPDISISINRGKHAAHADNEEYSLAISRVLDRAIKDFSPDLKSRFAHSGTVIQLISEKKVMVNLGSAYGLRPGDNLIVWREMGVVTDPATGITTIPKEKKGMLKVIQITSGLTCITQGPERLISELKIGDKVDMY